MSGQDPLNEDYGVTKIKLAVYGVAPMCGDGELTEDEECIGASAGLKVSAVVSMAFVMLATLRAAV